jgi:hypothetical protein
MANGDFWEAIEGLRGDIRGLMITGCAKREGDMGRIDAVEKTTDAHGRKLDRIYYTSLVTAGGIIAFLLKAVLPVIFGGK